MRSRVFVKLGVVLALGALLWPNLAGQAFAAPADVKSGIPAGYTVYQTVALNPRESGISGFLQILQDERVTAKYRDRWGSTRAPEVVLDEDDPLLKSIKATPLRNGRFRMVGDNGRVIADKPFEVPLGKIKTAFLYGTEFPTYLVTVDYGVGFGSYAGPETMLAEVRGESSNLSMPLDKRILFGCRKRSSMDGNLSAPQMGWEKKSGKLAAILILTTRNGRTPRNLS